MVNFSVTLNRVNQGWKSVNAKQTLSTHGRKVWTGIPTKIVDGYTHRLQ